MTGVAGWRQPVEEDGLGRVQHEQWDECHDQAKDEGQAGDVPVQHVPVVGEEVIAVVIEEESVNGSVYSKQFLFQAIFWYKITLIFSKKNPTFKNKYSNFFSKIFFF